jgi:hypothetical protein
MTRLAAFGIRSWYSSAGCLPFDFNEAALSVALREIRKSINHLKSNFNYYQTRM